MKLLHSGGCPRDVASKCPAGWRESSVRTSFLPTCRFVSRLTCDVLAKVTCIPPDDYNGRCGETSLVDLASAEQKESFAWKCRAGWPCQAACKRDYSKCPKACFALVLLMPCLALGVSLKSWSGVGQLCIAPSSYDGICSPAMDFHSYTDAEKLAWGAMCASAWLVFFFPVMVPILPALRHVVARPCAA